MGLRHVLVGHWWLAVPGTQVCPVGEVSAHICPAHSCMGKSYTCPAGLGCDTRDLLIYLGLFQCFFFCHLLRTNLFLRN